MAMFIDSLRPCDTIWCRESEQSLVHQMACSLLGTIPLPEQKLAYCLSFSYKQTCNTQKHLKVSLVPLDPHLCKTVCCADVYKTIRMPPPQQQTKLYSQSEESLYLVVGEWAERFCGLFSLAERCLKEQNIYQRFLLFANQPPLSVYHPGWHQNGLSQWG